MEKKIKIIFVFIVFIVMYLSTNSAHAAPAAWGIAFNHDTKECARYWEGDEFVNYDLPQGWKQYYPCDYGIDDGYYGYRALRADIEAIIGTFNFTEEEFCSMWPVEFCNITGYTYVSDNIGYQAKIDLEQTISTIIVIMLLLSKL